MTMTKTTMWRVLRAELGDSHVGDDVDDAAAVGLHVLRVNFARHWHLTEFSRTNAHVKRHWHACLCCMCPALTYETAREVVSHNLTIAGSEKGLGCNKGGLGHRIPAFSAEQAEC